MDLIKIIDENASAVLSQKFKTKDDILQKIASLAVKGNAAKNLDKDLIYSKLKEREDQGSTGFGNEVAIPHCRIAGLTELQVMIISVKKGVEFNAMDKKKVKLLFVILAPEEQVNEHLKILAMISRVLNQSNVKQELLEAKSTETLKELFIRNSGERASAPKAMKKMKLFFIILYMDDFLYHILEFFIEQGIDGATILDSSGMGEFISNVPLFATFIGFMNKNKNMSKTIMTMIPEDQETAIVEGIEKITGDLSKNQGAMVMSMDVSMYKGSMAMM